MEQLLQWALARYIPENATEAETQEHINRALQLGQAAIAQANGAVPGARLVRRNHNVAQLDTGDEDVNEIVNDPQNTHNTKAMESMRDLADRLRKQYPQLVANQNLLSNYLQTIEHEINKLKYDSRYEKKKDGILKVFYYMTRDGFPKFQTDVKDPDTTGSTVTIEIDEWSVDELHYDMTIAQALGYIWHALNDPNSLPSNEEYQEAYKISSQTEIKKQKRKDIKDRQTKLFDAMWDISQNPQCPTGTFNDMLGVLIGSHPIADIKEINSGMFKNFNSEKIVEHNALLYMSQKIQKLISEQPIEEQIKILCQWSEGGDAADTFCDQYGDEIIEHVRTKLLRDSNDETSIGKAMAAVENSYYSTQLAKIVLKKGLEKIFHKDNEKKLLKIASGMEKNTDQISLGHLMRLFDNFTNFVKNCLESMDVKNLSTLIRNWHDKTSKNANTFLEKCGDAFQEHLIHSHKIKGKPLTINQITQIKKLIQNSADYLSTVDIKTMLNHDGIDDIIQPENLDILEKLGENNASTLANIIDQFKFLKTLPQKSSLTSPEYKSKLTSAKLTEKQQDQFIEQVEKCNGSLLTLQAILSSGKSKMYNRKATKVLNEVKDTYVKFVNNQQLTKEITNEFLKTITKQFDELFKCATQRQRAIYFITNLLIAFTGIGLLVLGGKAAYSYATTKRPTLFNHPSKSVGIPVHRFEKTARAFSKLTPIATSA